MTTHTTTFTAAGLPPWTPILVYGDDLARRQRAVVHELLGSSTPAVSFLPTLARSGKFDILAEDAASAAAGLALLSSARPITMTDPGRPDLTMRLVITGDITQKTDTVTKTLILMTMQFQEVPL